MLIYVLRHVLGLLFSLVFLCSFFFSSDQSQFSGCIVFVLFYTCAVFSSIFYFHVPLLSIVNHGYTYFAVSLIMLMFS